MKHTDHNWTGVIEDPFLEAHTEQMALKRCLLYKFASTKKEKYFKFRLHQNGLNTVSLRDVTMYI